MPPFRPCVIGGRQWATAAHSCHGAIRKLKQSTTHEVLVRVVVKCKGDNANYSFLEQMCTLYSLTHLQYLGPQRNHRGNHAIPLRCRRDIAANRCLPISFSFSSNFYGGPGVPPLPRVKSGANHINSRSTRPALLIRPTIDLRRGRKRGGTRGLPTYRRRVFMSLFSLHYPQLPTNAIHILNTAFSRKHVREDKYRALPLAS